jgi:acetoin utilization protein AcuB
MVAEDLISDSIVPLRTSDTGEDALEIMSDFFVRHLPIVNNEQLLGLLSEDDILNYEASEPVGSYGLSLTHSYVRANDHIYEVMRQLAEHHLTVIPVVDLENNYIGLITLEDLLQSFAKMGAFSEPGSIIVLDIGKRDYSLAEISRIVESENSAILSSLITNNLDSDRIDVTIKINRQNIQGLLATLERFNYQVKASFHEADYVDSLKDRFDALMSYLNV